MQTGAEFKVVIVGGGFAGIEAAKGLKNLNAEVTLIDRQNHHCFQPLLYQVATAALSPSDIAWPIRAVLSGQANTRVVMGEVTGIDRSSRIVTTAAGVAYPYDFLIIATGSTPFYFGHDDWSRFAPGLKTVEDAIRIKNQVLLAFENAEIAEDPAERQKLLTFLIIGGGPTGVEMAGAIAEISRYALARDFRRINPRVSKIVLVEGGPRLLGQFPEDLSGYARRHLTKMGVDIITGEIVTQCDAGGVRLGEARWLKAGTVFWAAGVKASNAAIWLDAPADRAGRIKVEPDLTVPGHPSIFAIGDTASVVEGGKPVPGLAPAAKQMGRYVAETIRARTAGKATRAFSYKHYGDFATIGRKAAVVAIGRLELRGAFAWLFWSCAHIYYLISARSRLIVALDWAWDYMTFQRGSRLISESRKSETAVSYYRRSGDMPSPPLS